MANTESAEQLKKTRFQTTRYGYDQNKNMTSLLRSIGIYDVNKIEDNYIVTQLGVPGHVIASIIDIGTIRSLKAHGIDIDTSDETMLYAYDSNRCISHYDEIRNYGEFAKKLQNSPKTNWMLHYRARKILRNQNESNFGGVLKNTKFINRDQQQYGTCWFQSAVSALTMSEEPDLIQQILNGELSNEIDSFSSYYNGKLGFLKDFITFNGRLSFLGDMLMANPIKINFKQMVKIQQIANESGISVLHDNTTKETKPFVEHIINEEMQNRIVKMHSEERHIEKQGFTCSLYGLAGYELSDEEQKALGVNCHEEKKVWWKFW
ncbi:hypothetical protein FACS1894152_7250 [Bacilli bacterium]|nr:hypothetical protein FACS1894152_7250 [Bacilli bacterium]